MISNVAMPVNYESIQPSISFMIYFGYKQQKIEFYVGGFFYEKIE